jgi:hypothetical protein
MQTLQLTPTQAKKCISGLTHLVARKCQQIRSIERKKETLIEQVGEDEINHRIYMRQRWVSKADELINELSDFINLKPVS